MMKEMATVFLVQEVALPTWRTMTTYFLFIRILCFCNLLHPASNIAVNWLYVFLGQLNDPKFLVRYKLCLRMQMEAYKSWDANKHMLKYSCMEMY